jgi:hypothetical protein
MRTSLQLAAALLLIGAATTHAQVSNPDKLVGRPPQPPTRQVPQITDDMQWIWQYAQPNPIGRANDLRLDERFQTLVATNFKQPQAMWGTDPQHRLPLAAVIPLFLTKDGSITSGSARYLSIDGCVPSFCPASGLLWIDLGTSKPLMVFAAINWVPDAHATSEAAADYNLWLFPNRNVDANGLPLELVEAISHWNIRLAAAHRLVPHVANALLVEPDGTPYPLDPQLAGANSIAPQPDTTTPQSSEK